MDLNLDLYVELVASDESWFSFSDVLTVVALASTLIFYYVWNKRNIKKLQEQHERDLEQVERHHEDQLKVQNRLNRVSVMPYLVIDSHLDDMNSSIRKMYNLNDKGGYDFEVNVSNKGSGSALLISPVQDEDCLICNTPIATYKYITKTSDFCSDIIPPSKGGFIKIEVVIKKDRPNKNVYSEKISFQLKFKDLFFNEYEQEFDLELSTFKVVETTSHIPRLKKRYEGDYLD